MHERKLVVLEQGMGRGEAAGEPKCVGKPLYEHDCPVCIFLGTFRAHDLYLCVNEPVTVLARWSSDGPDYLSGMCFVPDDLLLREACARAVEREARSTQEVKATTVAAMWLARARAASRSRDA